MHKNITFIDTCIISQALQDKLIMRNLIRFIVKNKCFCGISTKTLSELHKSNSLFTQFHKYLIALPFFVIKPTKILVENETDKINSSIPVQVSFASLQLTISEIEKLTSKLVSIIDNEFPKGAKNIVIDHIKKLKKNFPPKNGKKYTNKEAIVFSKKLIIQQLEDHYTEFHNKLMGKEIDPYDFKSLKSQALITFWKFYKTDDRRTRDSDVFDISMASCFPYMDIILTEKNMANDIIQIKKQGLGFSNIKEIHTIKTLKIDDGISIR